MSFFAEIHGVRDWETRRDELLDMLRMTPFRDRLADRLSGGMKQKLALACTLIHTPELLVLDEPTTGVDPVSRRDFWRILARLQREGLTLLLTTPYLDEAERCQRVALMDRGRILNVSTPDALRASATGAVVEILAAPKRRAAELLAGAGRGDRRRGLRRAPPRDPPRCLQGRRAAAGERLAQALPAAGVAVQHVRTTAPSLEDLFIARIRGRRGGRPRRGDTMTTLVPVLLAASVAVAPAQPPPSDPAVVRLTLAETLERARARRRACWS